jgi:hypothetical protein
LRSEQHSEESYRLGSESRTRAARRSRPEPEQQEDAGSLAVGLTAGCGSTKGLEFAKLRPTGATTTAARPMARNSAPLSDWSPRTGRASISAAIGSAPRWPKPSPAETPRFYRFSQGRHILALQHQEGYERYLRNFPFCWSTSRSPIVVTHVLEQRPSRTAPLL